MEYALFYADAADAPPYRPEEDDIGEWVDRWGAVGALSYGDRLRPDPDATTVQVRGGEIVATDGPFTESKESIGGFDVIEAADLDRAIEIAAGHPAARFGRVEIRPFMQWPDADPDYRVVPRDLGDRPMHGRRYVLFIIGGPAAAAPADEAGEDDPEAWVTEMDGRGVRLFGDVLQRPESATFVRERAGEVLLGDGPFAEATEWVAGFDLLEVADLAEAIEVASKHPQATGGTVELRPLWPFDTHEDHVARAARESGDRDARTEITAAAAVAMLKAAQTRDAG